jgi:uncharacterized membrane protein HdeD (DUF308 family)
MKRRLWSVTIIAWLFLVVGAADTFRGLSDVSRRQFHSDSLWPIGLGAVAVVCGFFLLRRSNWARWIAVAWLAFHVAVSFGSVSKLIMHGVLLVVLAYFLFRPQANACFRSAEIEAP